MKDRTLAEKSIAEECILKLIIQAGVNRESSRANVEVMQARPAGHVNKAVKEPQYLGGVLDAKINHLQVERYEDKEDWKVH